MNHWFDTVASEVARSGISRRDAMGAILKTGITAAGMRLFGGEAAVAQSQSQLQAAPERKPLPPVKQGACTFTTTADNVAMQFVTETKIGRDYAKFIDYASDALCPSGETLVRHSYIFEGKPFIEAYARRSKSTPGLPEVEVSMRFAHEIKGAHEMTFRTTNGRTFEGDVDGRAFRPFEASTHPGELKFQDGLPAPKIVLDRDGTLALQALLVRSVRDTKGCKIETDTATKSAITATPFDASNTNDTGRSDNTRATTSCRNCLAVCAAGGALAGAAAAACCAATFGFGCGACIAAAVAAEAFCIHQCQTSPDCCPVLCGEVACCFGGDSCLDQNRGVCCGPNLTPCRSRACCGNNDICMPDGSCCPAGQAVCNNVCCQPGEACSTEGICCKQLNPGAPPISCRGQCCGEREVCKEGVTCCPPDQPVCNGVCCNGGACDQQGNCCLSPSQVCGGVCCPPLNSCCAATCCSGIGVRCHPVTGLCCPVVCGQGCCAEGQFCQDGKCHQCDTGQHVCTVQGEPRCCPDGTECCRNGQCCPAGTCCCPSGNGWTCCPLSDVFCTPR